MKKQFRLYDIYRYLTLREASSIKGIKTYAVIKEPIWCNFNITVCLDSEFVLTYNCTSEAEFKEAVRDINKTLNNCATPGPRSCRGKQIRFKI
jgi:hypothetical protein